ncbi:rab9, putative [Entamoeba invadens IP1]|uniref:rab9, putative n=1 Tax=Entamoeba invadens IP1 TaxID=370355 RepID=UPI0002C3E287|nr:rab9, putative [Entamoeba invadens IP1]ELP85437.1 rab9, putative [Entamoeba invadens IP1]|eukprot:XP_004184783.1 rab9, putative [Entamoeba invadens IP1]
MSCCAGKKQSPTIDITKDEPDVLPISEQLSKGVKIVLLGESATGKTCIVHRYITNEFTNQSTTVGCAFNSKTINYNNKIIKYEIWDAAGQERYRSLSAIYYRNATVALLVFDITRQETFNAVTDWVDELKQNTSNSTMIFIVGNKCDLADQRLVKESTIQDYIKASNSNIIGYMECSAKTGKNIPELFDQVSAKLLTLC